MCQTPCGLVRLDFPRGWALGSRAVMCDVPFQAPAWRIIEGAACGGIFQYAASERDPLSVIMWHQVLHDYPPDLSILIGGGKEINRDVPSNGE